MKKILVILVIGFLIVNRIEAKKVSGYFISLSKDTIKVTYIISHKFLSNKPNFKKLQWKIEYYDSENHKQVLRPEMAIEIGFNFKGEKTTMLSRFNIKCRKFNGYEYEDYSNLFLRVIKDGKIKLFVYYASKNSSFMYTSGTSYRTGSYNALVKTYSLEKDNGLLFSPSSLTFRKDMTEYLSDCPDLVRKIKARIYRRKDIEKIIDEYNNTCK